MVFGCGGATELHVGEGERVVTVFLTSGEGGPGGSTPEEVWRTREAESVVVVVFFGLVVHHFMRLPAGHLEANIERAVQSLQPVLAREEPGLVYLPHTGENHPDHIACLPIVRSAIAAAGIPAPDLWLYEVWTPLSEYNNVYDIGEVMATKLRAVRCYRSQLAQFRYDRSARGLSEYRGALAGGCHYAEVFLWASSEDD